MSDTTYISEEMLIGLENISGARDAVVALVDETGCDVDEAIDALMWSGNYDDAVREIKSHSDPMDELL